MLKSAETTEEAKRVVNIASPFVSRDMESLPPRRDGRSNRQMSIVVDEQPLFEPSSNIKRDLNDVVTRELFNNGIFSGSQTYDDAPNPCLRIEGYGSFGLPLNEREVRDMEVFAAGAESGVEVGHGGLTFPDDKVHIDNPLFDKYVKNTVGPALNAQVFGPKVKGFTDVNYRLRSLTLRGSGSEYVASQTIFLQQLAEHKARADSFQIRSIFDGASSTGDSGRVSWRNGAAIGSYHLY